MRFYQLAHVLLFVVLCEISAKQDTLILHFFGSSTCDECNTIKEQILYPLQAQYPQILSIILHDVEKDEELKQQLLFEQHYKITDAAPQLLFFPDTFLMGFEKIMTYGRPWIEKYLQNQNLWTDVQAPDTTSKKVSDNIVQQRIEERQKKGKQSPFNYIRDLSVFVIGVFVIVLRKKKFAPFISHLILGITFIIASSSKLFAPHTLGFIIKSYGIVPSWIIPIAAVIMPWFELVCAVMIMDSFLFRFGVSRLGALGIVGMNLCFIPAILYRAIMTSLHDNILFFSVLFDCGCGLGENFAWVLIVRDIGYLCLGAVALKYTVQKRDVLSLILGWFISKVKRV